MSTAIVKYINVLDDIFKESKYEFCYEIIEDRRVSYGIGWGEIVPFLLITIDKNNRIIEYSVENFQERLIKIVKLKSIKSIYVPKDIEEHVKISKGEIKL